MAETGSALARAQENRRKSATKDREAFKSSRGKHSKWVLLILGLLVPLLWWWRTEGAEKVEKMKESMMTPQQPVAQAPVGPNTDPYKGPVPIQVLPIKPVVVEAPTGGCIWWTDSRGPASNHLHMAYVKNINEHRWTPWPEFLEKKEAALKAGRNPPTFMHVMFVALTEPITMHYHFGRWDQCS